MYPITKILGNYGKLQRNLIHDTELLFAVLVIGVNTLLQCITKKQNRKYVQSHQLRRYYRILNSYKIHFIIEDLKQMYPHYKERKSTKNYKNEDYKTST